jgi:hypothetical protein
MCEPAILESLEQEESMAGNSAMARCTSIRNSFEVNEMINAIALQPFQHYFMIKAISTKASTAMSV